MGWNLIQPNIAGPNKKLHDHNSGNLLIFLRFHRHTKQHGQFNDSSQLLTGKGPAPELRFNSHLC